MNAPAARRREVYRLVWRWHFYAGLFCLPFVVWLSATGLIYLFKPQIEPLLERQYAHVSIGPPRPASAQVAAALKAVPGGVLNAYQVPASADAATRVLVGKGAEIIRVFVDPSSLRVLHVVRDNDRFMRVIFYLHGELLLGTAGSMLVELAASWTILLLLSGLYLWWPRGGRLGGVLYPRWRHGPRIFWRDMHAVTGVWIACFALFLLLSGLPWSKSWGGMLRELRQACSGAVAVQDWTTGSAQERATIASQNAPPRAPSMPGMSMPMDAGAALGRLDYSPLDRLVPAVAAERLAPPVLIAPPSQLKPSWTARSDADDRPRRADLVLDAASGSVVGRTNFAQHPLLDRIIGYGVAIHEGQLFPPLNQILGAFTALGLLSLAASALAMWWRRRPAGGWGAPPMRDGVRYPGAAVGALVLLGCLLPLLGATMVLVWLLERAYLRLRR